MQPEYLALVKDLEATEFKLGELKSKLAMKRMNCHHAWSAPVYVPIVREAYTDPGDPEGTMGIDRRLPTYIPRQETPKWKRECQICGLTQFTDKTTEVVHKLPKF